MVYGHRRDAEGYARCLERLDARLPEVVAELGGGDWLVLPAEQGGGPPPTPASSPPWSPSGPAAPAAAASPTAPPSPTSAPPSPTCSPSHPSAPARASPPTCADHRRHPVATRRGPVGRCRGGARR